MRSGSRARSGAARAGTAPASRADAAARGDGRVRQEYPSIHIELVLTSRVVDLVAEGIDPRSRGPARRLDARRAQGRRDKRGPVRPRPSTSSAAAGAKKDERARGPTTACCSAVAAVTRPGCSTDPTARSVSTSRARSSADDFGFLYRATEAGHGIAQLPLFMGSKCGKPLERVLPSMSSRERPCTS